MYIKEYYHIKGKKVPVIRGGKGGCFAAGTMIKTISGEMPIEKICIGDQVLSFDNTGKQSYRPVTHIHKHTDNALLKIIYWGGELIVTPNHWFLTDTNEFKEIGHFVIGEGLVSIKGNIIPIIDMIPMTNQKVYNLTVEDNNTYYANGLAVHNKGGGKAAPTGGVEAENTLFSTDMLVLLLGIGEGPIYRINPNGPQDIEINDGTIEDLLNIDGDGSINTDNFYLTSTTGTLTQAPLKGFGTESISPQTLANPVTLKKGNIDGVPEVIVNMQNTSTGTAWDRLRFNFTINTLQSMDDNGNTNPAIIKIRIEVFDNTGTRRLLPKIDKEIEGKQVVPYKFSVDAIIPEEYKSELGYKFRIKKTSNERDTVKWQDSIVFTGWDEILEVSRAYPRTALYGIALKAVAEYTGGIPTFTNTVKGILTKVPNNYTQPTLKNGEIDWRHLELPEDGEYGYREWGYLIQGTGKTIRKQRNPVIYNGLWDGGFVWSWTQNPVWIVYHLLTDPVHGLGIPENYIEKYKFYRVAQYCDAVDMNTGRFEGVDGISDGSYINCPLGFYDDDTQAVRKLLLGIPPGIAIKERRFTCDIVISSQKQVMDIISQITSLFRGVLYYSAGKITLNVDMPEEIPSALFSESNIQKDSMMISGIKESEIVTGVEITYIEPMNHSKREIARIDDPDLLREARYVENIVQVDLPGCSRRSQAIRFGQYILANSKYIRRKINFKTTTDALTCAVGDVISVAQRQVGTAWGYAGMVFEDSNISSKSISLEHFTSPAVPSTYFTSNIKPLLLRVLQRRSDKIDLFMLQKNTSTFENTGNVVDGFDRINVTVIKQYDPRTSTFKTISSFQANSVPQKGDLWTLGTGDGLYTNTGDKLFKITNIDRDSDEIISIGACEYVSNIYTDSDTIINYSPLPYLETYSPLVPPPAPLLDLIPRVARNEDGSVRYDLEIQTSTDRTGYPILLHTDIEIAYPEHIIETIG